MQTIILLLFLGNSHMMQVIFDDKAACETALSQVHQLHPGTVEGTCVTTSTIAPGQGHKPRESR